MDSPMTELHADLPQARDYDPADRDGCVALFRGNVPEFFLASEEAQFVDFLDRCAVGGSYQVIERAGHIVACGGHLVEDDGITGSFCWGMVERGSHRTGLGSLLVAARLRAARATPGVTQIRLDTSQKTQAFYARFGFQCVSVTKDGYGPGLDRWDMLLHL